jgi:hypothetical protein
MDPPPNGAIHAPWACRREAFVFPATVAVQPVVRHQDYNDGGWDISDAHGFDTENSVRAGDVRFCSQSKSIMLATAPQNYSDRPFCPTAERKPPQFIKSSIPMRQTSTPQNSFNQEYHRLSLLRQKSFTTHTSNHPPTSSSPSALYPP